MSQRYFGRTSLSPRELPVQGRIPKPTFYAIVAILFCVAIVSAIFRTVLRWRKTKRIKPDDALMILASLCLIGTTTLAFQMIPLIYEMLNLLLNPSPVFELPGMSPPRANDGLPSAVNSSSIEISSSPEELSPLVAARIIRFRLWVHAFMVVSWTTIFCVKFSFLGFFRELVDRIRPLELYWKVVVVLTGISYCYCVSETFFSCRGDQAAACGHPPALTHLLRFQAVTIMLDILTDILIISIPVRLLWRVQIKLRQKLGLGTFLSLSICMIVVSAIRLGGEVFRGSYDPSWLFFWQAVESCIAVSVLSLTACPTIFMSRTSARASGGAISHGQPGRQWSLPSVGRSRCRQKIYSNENITGTSSYTSKRPSYQLQIMSGTGRVGRSEAMLGNDEQKEMPLGQGS